MYKVAKVRVDPGVLINLPGNMRGPCISPNCLNVILFKNYRDSRQIITFGSQILPGKVPFFKAAYELATQPNFGYLHVCLEPKQNREYQSRSHILPREEMVIYQPI